MAGSPRFKVYNPQGEYVASARHVEDAAAVVSNWGEGATIRDGSRNRRIVFRDGENGVSAGNSFDDVADIVKGRIRDFDAEARVARRAATA